MKGNGFGVQPTTKKLALDVDTLVFVSVIQTNQKSIKKFRIVSFSGLPVLKVVNVTVVLLNKLARERAEKKMRCCC